MEYTGRNAVSRPAPGLRGQQSCRNDSVKLCHVREREDLAKPSASPDKVFSRALAACRGRWFDSGQSSSSRLGMARPTILLSFAEEARLRGRTALTPYHPVHPGRLATLPDDGLPACREQSLLSSRSRLARRSRPSPSEDRCHRVRCRPWTGPGSIAERSFEARRDRPDANLQASVVWV